VYNACFVGLPDKSIKPLQYIQNSAARVLTCTLPHQQVCFIVCIGYLSSHVLLLKLTLTC